MQTTATASNVTVRPWAVLLSTVGTLLVTNLTIAGVCGGKPLNDRPNEPPVLPAEYAFGIWGPIYLGLLLYAVYQALPSQRHNPRFAAAAPWVVANCVLNALWLPMAYHGYEGLPLVLLFGYLVTLVFITRRLQVGRQAVSSWEIGLAQVPFGLCFGWITVAGAVGVSGYLKSLGAQGLELGEPAWVVLVLLVALAIILRVYQRFPNRAYLLVLTWAGIGIALADRPRAVQLAAAGVAAVALIRASTPLPKVVNSAAAFERVGR